MQDTKTESQAIVGVVIDELDQLDRCKADGRQHPKENRLHGGDLDTIRYLDLYNSGQSVRIYFVVLDGVIWVLALNAAKRRTNLGKGDAKKLTDRQTDVRALHEATKPDGKVGKT